MSDELETLRPPKSQDVEQMRFADYLRDFLSDPLVPTLQRMRSEDAAEFNRRLDEQAARYEKTQNHQYDLIKGMDAQSRETWHNMRETAHEFRESAQELRDETKDSRSAKEQLARVTVDLQRATEDIVDKNKQQDEAIEILQEFRVEAEIKIKNLEHDVEMLRSHKVAMVEMLSGDPSTPGIITRIDENSAQIAAFKAMLDKQFEAIEKHFEELGKPRGLSKIIQWMNKNPLVMLVVGMIILLVVH